MTLSASQITNNVTIWDYRGATVTLKEYHIDPACDFDIAIETLLSDLENNILPDEIC